jgi:cytochrome bd-type quinol oxidase subunit 1
MQNPVGAAFNPETMRMEVTDFSAVLFNPVAQAKFVHTVSAGYVCAATFVMGVSAIYCCGQMDQRGAPFDDGGFGLRSGLGALGRRAG